MYNEYVGSGGFVGSQVARCRGKTGDSRSVVFWVREDGEHLM